MSVPEELTEGQLVELALLMELDIPNNLETDLPQVYVVPDNVIRDNVKLPNVSTLPRFFIS